MLTPYYTEPTVRLYHGHVLEVLRTLPASSVQCCVTSPPYWGLRDYGLEPVIWDDPGGAWVGSLGLEPTPSLYVSHLVQVFQEVWRVLRDDGTCWINLGSSFVSGIIESSDYIIRGDLTGDELAYVYQELGKLFQAKSEAVSTMRTGHAPAKPTMPDMLSRHDSEASALSQPDMPNLRQDVQNPQDPCGERSGKVLLKELCQVGQSNSQKDQPNSQMPDMRNTVQQISSGNTKEPREQSLLQQPLLVQLQSEGQSLPLDRRTARTDQSRGHEMEKGCSGEGQISLSALPCESEARSASYSPIRELSCVTLGGDQRDNALSSLSCHIQEPRNGVHRRTQLHRLHPTTGLEGITLHHSRIPSHLRRFFRPKEILKPKDDAGIPWRVAFALQDAGWYLRSDIIWHKPNPMPESVTDRPTKSHEYLFLLSKQERYVYDAHAIREPRSLDSHGGPNVIPGRKATALGQGNGHLGRWTEEDKKSGRNKRSVWTIPTQHYSEAHFATFPRALVEPCILAGSSEHGACADCGAPWHRVTERYRTHNGVRADDLGPWRNTDPGSPIGAQGDSHKNYATISETKGWAPTCTCQSTREPIPCTVLDPFAGSGTVMDTARDLQRHSIGIDLNEAYLMLAMKRLRQGVLNFSSGA